MGSRMAGWGLWVAARSAAAHSRDLVCCVNRVEVIPSFSELPGVRSERPGRRAVRGVTVKIDADDSRSGFQAKRQQSR